MRSSKTAAKLSGLQRSRLNPIDGVTFAADAMDKAPSLPVDTLASRRAGQRGAGDRLAGLGSARPDPRERKG